MYLNLSKMTKKEMKQMIQCLLSENKRLKKKLNKYQVPNNFSITERQQLRSMLMGDYESDNHRV